MELPTSLSIQIKDLAHYGNNMSQAIRQYAYDNFGYKIEDFAGFQTLDTIEVSHIQWDRHSRFLGFTTDELYTLQRQAIESSFSIMEDDSNSYPAEIRHLHSKLLNEITEELRKRDKTEQAIKELQK